MRAGWRQRTRPKREERGLVVGSFRLPIADCQLPKRERFMASIHVWILEVSPTQELGMRRVTPTARHRKVQNKPVLLHFALCVFHLPNLRSTHGGIHSLRGSFD